MDAPSRPARPLGLSLMLVTCFVIYVVGPLLALLYPVLLARLLRPEGGDSGADLGALGASQVGFSLVFAVVSVLAWRGRPPQIRWALAGLALLQAAVVIGYGLWLLRQPGPFDSMDELQRRVQPYLMIGASALGLFVAWYVNRAPAVAFFTGRPVAYIEDEADN